MLCGCSDGAAGSYRGVSGGKSGAAGAAGEGGGSGVSGAAGKGGAPGVGGAKRRCFGRCERQTATAPSAAFLPRPSIASTCSSGTAMISASGGSHRGTSTTRVRCSTCCRSRRRRRVGSTKSGPRASLRSATGARAPGRLDPGGQARPVARQAGHAPLREEVKDASYLAAPSDARKVSSTSSGGLRNRTGSKLVPIPAVV
jgi:hypothetical protein